jgi:hypothetical protein
MHKKLREAASISIEDFLRITPQRPASHLELIVRVYEFLFADIPEEHKDRKPTSFKVFNHNLSVVSTHFGNSVPQNLQLEFFKYFDSRGIKLTPDNVAELSRSWYHNTYGGGPRTPPVASPTVTTHPLSYPAIVAPVASPTVTTHPVTYPAIAAPVTYPAIAAPVTYPAIAAPVTYPAIAAPVTSAVVLPTGGSDFFLTWTYNVIGTELHDVPAEVKTQFFQDIVTEKFSLNPENIHHVFSNWCQNYNKKNGTTYQYDVVMSHSLPAIENHQRPQSTDLIDLFFDVGPNISPSGVMTLNESV